ncbi:MAG: hypothetical protein L6Q81_07530 [Bacteroidia bacterium]|nr:hypothetical protein [Bacteroidia bacterium]
MSDNLKLHCDLVTTVYGYSDPVPADLNRPLDSERLFLLERIYSRDGKETIKELYDSESESVTQTVESFYNELDLLISSVEKNHEGEQLEMERKYTYTETGKLKRESEFCDGDLLEETEYFYDSNDRLIRETHTSDGNQTMYKEYKYRADSNDIVKVSEYSAFGLCSETTTSYKEIDGVFERIESEFVNKQDPMLSRKFTFNPENGTNGHVYETEWSTQGRMLSTTRYREEATEKGKITTIEECVDDSLESVPFQRIVFMDDIHGNEVYREYRTNGVLTMMTSSVFDENKRKSREYHNSGNEHILTVYKYEQR